MSEIVTHPSTWAVVPLGQFVEHEKGKKPKNQKAHSDDVFKYPYVDIEAFEKNNIRSWTDGLGSRLCDEDDFLMVWDGSRSGLVGKGMTGALGSTLVRINFPSISNKYAFFFLQSKYLEINTRAKGVGIPHVDPALLWNYRFPIPPSNEQKRIVAKIEELFSGLDKGVESLKTASTQLKIYRQAILKHAFEGKFTTEWRKVNRISGEWGCVPVSELLAIPLSNGRSVKDRAGGFPVLRLTALHANTLDLNEYKEGDWELRNAEPYLVIENDFFIARGNGSKHLVGIGKLAINVNSQVAFPDTMIRLRLNTSLINLEFFVLVWNSHLLRSQIETSARTTAGIYKINQSHVSNFQFPLPSLSEQNEIVVHLQTMLPTIDKTIDAIDFQISKSEALRQSILKKAFSGKLVAQDPNDEPASVLLERIKAEKNNKKKKEKAA